MIFQISSILEFVCFHCYCQTYSVLVNFILKLNQIDMDGNVWYLQNIIVVMTLNF